MGISYPASNMSYKNRQRLIAAAFAIVAVFVSNFSGAMSFVALPLSAVVLGWTFARFALLPARRQFIAERAAGVPVASRPSLPVVLGAAVGLAALAVLRQISDEFAAGVLAQYMALLSGGFFFTSRSETA